MSVSARILALRLVDLLPSRPDFAKACGGDGHLEGVVSVDEGSLTCARYGGGAVVRLGDNVDRCH